MNKLLCSIVGAGFALVSFATDYTWTGKAGDGKWASAANWNPSTGYPNSGADSVTFNGDATVLLDTGVDTPFKQTLVKAGTVELNATEGSRFLADHAYPDGFNVSGGATLKLNVPVWCSSRFDTEGSGTVIYGSEIGGTSGSIYIRNKYMTFTSGANITFYDPIITMGAISGRYEVRFEGNAAVNCSNRFRYCVGSTGTSDSVTVQDGAETLVKSGGAFTLGADTDGNNSARSSVVTYTLRNGKIDIGDSMYTTSGSPAAGCTVGGKFIQEGGEFSVFGNIYAPYGEYRFNGGKAKVDRIGHMDGKPNGDIYIDGGELTVVNNSIHRPVHLDSGKLVLSRAITNWGKEGVIIVGGGAIVLPKDADMSNLYDHLKFLPGATLRLETESESMRQLAIEKTASFPPSLELGRNVRLLVNAKADIVPNGSEIPRVKIEDGAELALHSQTARILVPIDLDIWGTGRVDFDHQGGYYSRDVIIAHSYTLNGEAQPKGKYLVQDDTTHLASETSSQTMVAVPHFWTGNGADNNWSNGDNWEGGVAPMSAAEFVCFFGDVGEVVVDGTPTVWGAAYHPSEAGSTLRLLGTEGGKLTFSSGTYFPTLQCAKGSTLAFDTAVAFTGGGDHYGFSGGGVFRFNGTAEGMCHQYGFALLDGVVELAGEMSGAYLTYSPHHNYNYIPPVNALRIVDGANIALSTLLHLDMNGFMGAFGIRQDGGTVTVPNLFTAITRPDNLNRNDYTLNGGTLNVTKEMSLGGDYVKNLITVDKTGVYAGGSFTQNGGTLNAKLISNECNSNYCRLLGGDAYIGEGGFTRTTTERHDGQDKPNATAPIVLGMVTLHAETDSWTSAADLAIDLTGDYEGENRTVLDVAAGKEVTLAGSIGGTGGLIKRGAGNLAVTGDYSATGDVLCENGLLSFEGGLSGVSLVETAGGMVALPAAVPAGLCLKLATANDLVLAADITVGRLVVGGVEKTGAQSLGGKTVTVATPAGAFVWKGAPNGDWLAEANWAGAVPNASDAVVNFNYKATDDSAIALGGAVMLGGLVLADDVTLSGDGVLTFAAGATVKTPEGTTLTLDVPVHAEGGITKVGGGKIVFKKLLRSAADPAELVFPAATRLKTEKGETVIDCPVEGMCVYAESTSVAYCPRVTLESGAVFVNRSIVHGPWCGLNVAGYGEIVMNGGKVDLTSGLKLYGSDGLDVNVQSDKACFCFFGSGRMSFTMNGGEYATPTNSGIMCFNLANTNEGGGDSTFTMNGGQFYANSGFYFGTQNGAVDQLILNGGKLIVGQFVCGSGVGKKIVVLNGGELHFRDSGAVEQIPVGMDRVEVAGEIDVSQDPDRVVTFTMPLTGEGTLRHVGAGSMMLRDFAPTLTLAAEAGSTLGLDYEGSKDVKSIVLDGRVGRSDKVYGVGNYKASYFEGTGTLHSLTGGVPGMQILVR